MIFLFKDHTFKVYSPHMPDHKIAKKFNKRKSDIVAVLVESSTRLRSDVYIIVKAEHFKPVIQPFYFGYSLTIGDDDTPITEDNTVTREVLVETIGDYYGMASLVYQMKTIQDNALKIQLGEVIPELLSLYIQYEGEDRFYCDVEGGEDPVAFINRQDMWCDTDSFLDASIGGRNSMVDEGCYIMRKNTSDAEMNLEYYHHGKRHLLWLKNRYWEFFSENIVPTIPSLVNEKRNLIDDLYGICINNTGLVYLAAYPFLVNYRDVDEYSVSMFTGHWESFKDTESGLELHEPVLENEHPYVCYNPVDTLYLTLYLPQIWDIQRFLCGIQPVSVSCEVLQYRHYRRTGVRQLPRLDSTHALQADLFSLLAECFTLLPKNIEFDEN